MKVTTFMTEYLQSLGLVTGQEGNGSKGDQTQPPQRMRKKRAMVVFGGEEPNVWETPLHEKIKGTTTNAATNDETTTKTTEESSVIDLSKSDQVPTEDFAEKLSFMQSDFTSQLTEQSEERKKTMEAQEAKLKKVKTEMESSLGEFRNYVTGVFTKQDKAMTALKSECKATNDELKKQTEFFGGELTEIKETMATMLNMMIPKAVTPEKPQAVSPLAGYYADSFTGKSIHSRAMEIREAEAAVQQTLAAEKRAMAALQQNNGTTNGLAKTLVGGSRNQ